MSLETNSFEFEGFVLDGEERVLLSDGKPVPLTPKALLLLKVLIENHGRLLEKRELMEAVWPDSFVEEGNLPYTANLLRKALGDNKEQPRFIETVPRRGYRFIAPVRLVTGEVAEPDEPARANARKWPRPIIPALAVLLVLVVALGIWLAAKARNELAAPILSQPFSVEQLPTSGNSRYAAISPDGKYAAYTDDSGGQQSVWLRSLDSSENIQIIPPSNDDYLGLTFSNNGNLLYFVRKPYDGHVLPSLYKITAFGGVPVKLFDNVVNRRAALSPDDKQIAFVRCAYRKDEFCSVIVADTTAENERKLFTTTVGVHIHDIRFSPDGRAVAVASGRISNDQNDAKIAEIDLETGAEKEMFAERFFEIGGEDWLPNGKGLIFSASDHKDGKAGIWSVSRSTGKLTPLTNDASSYSKLSLDREGRRLIAVQQIPDFRITAGAGGVTKTLVGARELTTSAGGKIAYSTFEGEIWSVNRDGTEQRQLTNSKAIETSLRISPDQQTIYFSSDESGKRHVWRMNADGTDRRQLTKTVGGFPLTVSTDGRYVFYRSSLDDWLYKVSADGGDEIVVYDKRAASVAVSPDGQLAAYYLLEKASRKIAIMRLETGEVIRTLDPGPGSSYAQAYTPTLAWAADSSILNYVLVTDGLSAIWQQPLGTGEPQKIADLGPSEVIGLTAADSGGFACVAGQWKYDVMLLRGLG